MSQTLSPNQAKTSPKTLKNKPLLEISHVSITFDGFHAISDVSTTVQPNEIRFFIGPNGAGKTTILDAICGKNKISSGSITFNPDQYHYRLDKLVDYKIFRDGVSRKFQTPSLFPGLTIYDNLVLAVTRNRSVFNALYAKLSGEQRDTIDEILDFIGLQDVRNELPFVLSHGQKQWLEIGLLMVSRPKLILLDEPCAGMGRKETDKTEVLLHQLKQRCAVICVEHDMAFCEHVSDSVTVFHEGRIIDEGSFQKVQSNPEVISVYLGRSEE